MISYRKIRHFKKDHIPSSDLIRSLITDSFNSVPSKQNLIAYKIHVFGPDHLKEKSQLYSSTVNKAGGQTNSRGNIQLFAPYILLFTGRLVDRPNPNVLSLISEGHRFMECDVNMYKENVRIPCIEIGMFCNILASKCFEKDIDIGFTGCLPNNISQYIDDINENIYLAMSIGYANNTKYKPNRKEIRPNIDEVINWY